MRTVLSNRDEVFHIWAHQGQDSGRAGNVSFWGSTVYSYAAPIGRIVENSREERAALITNRRYSVTTSCHTSIALRACSHLARFHVSDPSADPADSRSSMLAEIERKTQEIPIGRTKAIRAKRYQETQHYINECNEFARFFDLPQFDILPRDTEVEDIIRAIRERREREIEETAEKNRRGEARRQEEAREALSRWMAGEPVNVPHYLPLAYMRVVGDEIQTTRGAVVPVSHVRRLAPMILNLLDAKSEYIPDRDIRFGHYRLDMIGEDGTVVVGCHQFAASEIRRIASILLPSDGF